MPLLSLQEHIHQVLILPHCLHIGDLGCLTNWCREPWWGHYHPLAWGGSCLLGVGGLCGSLLLFGPTAPKMGAVAPKRLTHPGMAAASLQANSCWVTWGSEQDLNLSTCFSLPCGVWMMYLTQVTTSTDQPAAIMPGGVGTRSPMEAGCLVGAAPIGACPLGQSALEVIQALLASGCN